MQTGPPPNLAISSQMMMKLGMDRNPLKLVKNF